MISIIGNSPSSGSTLLADLLDSTPFTACGAELNLYSNSALYNFDRFKKNIKLSSAAVSVYKKRISLNTHRLYSYGLNGDEFREMVLNSEGLPEFINRFSENFLALRGKDIQGILFEKTPENVNCLEQFLSTFKESFFIYLVRNPLYVYPSLLKRGFAPYIALITWLIDVCPYIKNRNNTRVILIKYEHLVERPFETISDLLHKISEITIAPSQIEKNFNDNVYRKLHSKKIKTWSITDTGVVKNANLKKLDEKILMDLSMMLNIRLNPAYASHFGIPAVSFKEAVEILGYDTSVFPRLSMTNLCPKKTIADKKRLFLKWKDDFLSGDASLSDMKFYLNPTVPI